MSTSRGAVETDEAEPSLIMDQAESRYLYLFPSEGVKCSSPSFTSASAGKVSPEENPIEEVVRRAAAESADLM